jgi:hypothetical protein
MLKRRGLLLLLVGCLSAVGACSSEEVTCAGTGSDGIQLSVSDASSGQSLDSLSTGRIERLTSPRASAEGPLWPPFGVQHPTRVLQTDVIAGEYRITVTAPGYRTEQVTVEVRNPSGCIGGVPVRIRLTPGS